MIYAYMQRLAQIMGLSLLAFTALAADDAKIPDEILFYVNQYRAQHHLPPLKMVPLISQQALHHSQDMARHKMSFGHLGFNSRIKTIYSQVPDCQGGAENVAYNYRNAKHVVSQWLTSPGHRHNIEGHYNLTGIGVARDAKGKLYFTQIFIRNAA